MDPLVPLQELAFFVSDRRGLDGSTIPFKGGLNFRALQGREKEIRGKILENQGDSTRPDVISGFAF